MYGHNTTHTGGWTGDQVSALKKLWLEGQSASQIAKQLGGGVTRNAVIAKIHRLGLSRRAAPSQPARATLEPTRPQPPKQQPQFAVVPVTRESSVVQPVSVSPPERAPTVSDMPGTAILGTLGAHMCKWPIGNPESIEFSFCGRKTKGKDVYCVEHARVAYQPPSKRSSWSRPPAWMY